MRLGLNTVFLWAWPGLAWPGLVTVWSDLVLTWSVLTLVSVWLEFDLVLALISAWSLIVLVPVWYNLVLDLILVLLLSDLSWFQQPDLLHLWVLTEVSLAILR